MALSSFFKGFDYGLFSLASTAGADSLRHVVRAVAGRRPGRTPLRRAALVLAGARASLPTSSKKKIHWKNSPKLALVSFENLT